MPFYCLPVPFVTVHALSFRNSKEKEGIVIYTCFVIHYMNINTIDFWLWPIILATVIAIPCEISC